LCGQHPLALLCLRLLPYGFEQRQHCGPAAAAAALCWQLPGEVTTDILNRCCA
jgi:hypothetical protein